MTQIVLVCGIKKYKMFFVGNWRERPRNFTTSHYSVANYNTDIKTTADMNYGDDNFHNLHIIPDPFKKNLADQFVNPDLIRHLSTDLTSTPNNEKPMDQETNQIESTLSGITSFFSGVFNVLTLAMFRRGKSDYQMASDWQPASNECKNGSSDHIIGDDIKNAMSDCRTAAASCEDKLSKVRLLLNSRTPSSPVKCRSRRPKRVFVEPNSIDEHFEDAFSSEDYINLVNESYMEYYSPSQYHSLDYFQVQSPVMHVHNKEVNETIKTRKYLPKEVNAQPDNVNKCLLNQTKENGCKDELIASCEDKLQQLKAMLQENRKKNMNLHTETECTERNTKSNPIKIKDKRFKNPNRLRDKRKDAQMKQSIQDELHFAYEVTLDESSFEESPSFHSMEKIPEGIRFAPTPDCFDEITGKFCNSNSSEDSFQIVFSDVQRFQKLSDCESEDSFIIFDNSPDNCYTSNDVFGDTDESDSDSDASDSECANIRLWRKLSETVSNLADDSVFTEDVVDFAKPIDEGKKTGLLIDDRRKKLKKSLPPKKVRFSSDPPKVHVMRVWAFAARQARAGHWERFAVDRERFKRRIADVDMAVSWVLKPQHRTRVVFQRFMPWWNAQKRKELEEIKQREEEQLADDGVKTEQLIPEDLIGEQLKFEIENKEENSNEKEELSADVVLKEVTHSEIENKDQLNSVVGNKNKLLIEEENECKQSIVNAETSEKCSLKEEHLIYPNDNKEEKEEEGRKKGMSYGDIEIEKMKN